MPLAPLEAWYGRVAVVLLLAGAPVLGHAARRGDCPQQIDINQADQQTLRCLHGVGKKRAQALIDYRERHGPYPGPGASAAVLGVKLAQRLRPQLVVNPPPQGASVP